MSLITKNKQAFYDYEILEKFEAGIVLAGQEVKSVKQGGINLAGSYVIIRDNNASLINANISKYKYAGNLINYDPKKSRRLLLNRKELSYLAGKSNEKRLTILPLSVYTASRGKIKLEIGVGRGKKQFEKRDIIKNREAERELRRQYKV